MQVDGVKSMIEGQGNRVVMEMMVLLNMAMEMQIMKWSMTKWRQSGKGKRFKA